MTSGYVIRCWYSDPQLNRLLGAARAGSGAVPPGGPGAGSSRAGGFTRHFNQVEEFFLRLKRELSVPQLPIHHDVRRATPDSGYRELLRQVVEELLRLIPEPFQELTHLFDPAETLRPSFFRLHRVEDRQYLYLLRLDLMYRPSVHRVLIKGGNDYTPAYSTDQLFLEALNVPLEQVVVEEGEVRELRIDQTISSTWVDETGRGYFVQGIWIDNDLTRLFSKLLLPPGVSLYPFFPLVCKYKTVCQTVIDFAPEERGRLLPLLHQALQLLRPSMGEIEAAMKSGEFSEDNPVYRKLKARLTDGWQAAWEGLRLEAYLNEQNMKEFRIDRSPG